MCPMPIRAATILAVLTTIALASPASAWPFGGAAKPSATPAPAPSTGTAAPAKAAQPQPQPVAKATAAQRADIARQDPVTQVAFWTREVAIDPSDADAGTALATALRALGRPADAVDAAQRVLSLHPNHAPALFEVARAHISLGHGFYAIKPLQLAAAGDPKDVRPWALLGIAYEQNEQPELAKAAYDQALRISPDDPAALSNYALFRATHGDAAGAETMLRRAAAQPGASATERQNLALVLGLQGKMGEAERLIRQDLPPEQADANLAYLRSLNSRAAATPPPTGVRSWSAVQASEAAQQKAPS